MSEFVPTPLFVDTGPFYARFDTDDAHHERTVSIFNQIGIGNYLYRPVFTSRFILAETTRLLLQRVSHTVAISALMSIRQSELFTILAVNTERFDEACKQFDKYDDREITLVDHLSGVLAETQDVTHVFTFDPDDFRTLDFTAVPGDTGET